MGHDPEGHTEVTAALGGREVTGAGGGHRLEVGRDAAATVTGLRAFVEGVCSDPA